MLATARLRRLAGRCVFPAVRLGSLSRATDLHLHTTYTDGRSTVAQMLAAAVSAGLRTVAFTEHVRAGITWYGGFLAEVERERGRHPDLEVLTGIEAKARDVFGTLDADPALIARADLVLGAFHNYPDGQGGFLPAGELGPERAARIEFEALMALLDHPEVDVLAHPGGLTGKSFAFFPAAYTEALVRKAASVGRAVELNAEYGGPGALRHLLDVCRRERAWVTLGSNAHQASEVGRIGRRVAEVTGRGN